jgi:hypothetical protein
VLVVAFTSGNVTMFKRAAGVYSTIFTAAAGPAFKSAPDAVNSLRIVAGQDQKLTISLNGAPVKVIRAQMPAGPLRFGVFGETEKAPDSDVQVLVKNFKVTTGG